MSSSKHYAFVGPDHIRARLAQGVLRWRIAAESDVRIAAQALAPGQDQFAATYAIACSGELWIASLRSEHFCCANGEPVIAAGEMGFVFLAGRWSVSDVNNRSTGYCPEPSCWPAVQHALQLAGIEHPGAFTDSFEFRRCPTCGNINLVKESCFVCACGADLPTAWNLGPSTAKSPETIYFSRIRKPYGCLSNFAPYPVTVGGQTWATTEHYYQSQKFTDPDLQELIRAQPTPHDAAMVGRSRASEMRSDWETVKLSVMERALVAKATQHPDVAAELLKSGDALLVEKSPRDSFWGSGPDDKGANQLGQLWMRIRERLRCGELA